MRTVLNTRTLSLSLSCPAPRMPTRATRRISKMINKYGDAGHRDKDAKFPLKNVTSSESSEISMAVAAGGMFLWCLLIRAHTHTYIYIYATGSKTVRVVVLISGNWGGARWGGNNTNRVYGYATWSSLAPHAALLDFHLHFHWWGGVGWA